MNIICTICCLLALITLGCNKEPAPSRSVPHKDDGINSDIVSVTVDTKIDRFTVSNKSLIECLQILIDTSDPSFELEKRIIFISLREEDLNSAMVPHISLDVRNVPINELLGYIVLSAGTHAVSFRTLDSGEILAIIIGPLGFYPHEVLTSQGGMTIMRIIPVRPY